MKQLLFSVLAAALLLSASCNNSSSTGNNDNKNTAMKEPKIKEQTVSYQLDSAKMNSFVAYDENIEGKRPAVLVIHEWWGLNDYVKMRVRELARLGYIAIAVDMYGDNKMGNDPTEAGKLAMPFYSNTQLTKSRFDAAWNKLKEFPQTDTSRTAAIGYCFGGAMVLNLARMGEDLKGVVSFHGGLVGNPADKNLLKAKVLVLHGADDQFVKPEEVAIFKKQMDSIGASYSFKSYPGATHAFSNPGATAMGEKFKIPIAYNAAADTASWKEMNDFFGVIFK